MNRRLHGLLFAVPLLVVAACGGVEKGGSGDSAGASSDCAEESPTTLTIGMLAPSLSNAGIYIAEARGYFEEQGITLEQEVFRAGDAEVASLARGDLQIASGGPSAGLYNAVGRGVGVKVVADKGTLREGFEWIQFVTTQANYDAGLRSMADVRGKSIGIVGTGATQDPALYRTLQANGMEWEDVEVTVVPFPEMQAALENGSVDVIFPSEPFLTRALAQGHVAIGSSPDFYPDQQGSVIFYSEDFIAEQPCAAQAWMNAYLQGVRDYNDAFIKKEGLDEVKQILVDAEVVADPALLDQMNLVYINPNGAVNSESIAEDIEYYEMRGFLEVEANVEDLVDNTFVDRAVEELGEYEE